MPVIKVWCLPDMPTEAHRLELWQNIIAGVVAIPELGLKGPEDITCLFPPDLMKYGLGEEIIVEVTGLFDKPERTVQVRHRLAQSIGTRVNTLYPEAKVKVFIYPFNDRASGFWASSRER